MNPLALIALAEQLIQAYFKARALAQQAGATQERLAALDARLSSAIADREAEHGG